jgi:DNA-binding MarR family transcriptional regulator
MDKPPDSPLERVLNGYRILTWIGIIEQLSRTAAERALAELDMSFPEFSMLNHFSHGRPPEKTITGIAAAMQQNQPAVTKTAAKLIARGYVDARPNGKDGRSKILTLTETGRAAHEAAVAFLAPLIERAMEGWSDGEMADLFRHLDRLKTWMDANR